ncbi:MAG TPA: hypothetical protein VGO68_12110 [Pyrinomonadaceae bacterium]|jgi:hypothetical protein|nr:hypothetical protein [Pyrinomonadaceae bacterium]
MKTFCILALALTLSSCQQQPKVQTQQIEGRTYTTMSHGDLTLTYVELDKSTAVVFKSVGGFDGIDGTCVSCQISKISECAGPGKDSTAINACAKKKCEDEGKCKTDTKFSFGTIRMF